ncbi:MAG: alpha/beta fold hydrolase [Planctomycetota bacterium]|nr:alpha/beta fold hydrolase [Planctomycetota bacterium]
MPGRRPASPSWLALGPTRSWRPPVGFDAVVAAVAREHSVDRLRVYVVGHSMGGGLAADLARTRADVVAAVACFSAAAGPGAPPWPSPPSGGPHRARGSTIARCRVAERGAPDRCSSRRAPATPPSAPARGRRLAPRPAGSQIDGCGRGCAGRGGARR